MRFDLAPRGSFYQGISRTLQPKDFIGKRGTDSALLSRYFEYLDFMNPSVSVPFRYDRSAFEQLTGFLLDFQQGGIDCEIIAYDDAPLTAAFGKPVEFLGIDVVYDSAESLLELPDSVPEEVKVRLNKSFLCPTEADVPFVCKSCGQRPFLWRPCWVYRVVL